MLGDPAARGAADEEPEALRRVVDAQREPLAFAGREARDVALYPSYSLCLCVGAFKSNVTTMYSGFISSIILNIIVRNPYIAFVYVPSSVIISFDDIVP